MHQTREVQQKTAGNSSSSDHRDAKCRIIGVHEMRVDVRTQGRYREQQRRDSSHHEPATSVAAKPDDENRQPRDNEGRGQGRHDKEIVLNGMQQYVAHQPVGTEQNGATTDDDEEDT